MGSFLGNIGVLGDERDMIWREGRGGRLGEEERE